MPLDLSIFHKALRTSETYSELDNRNIKDFTSLHGSSNALFWTIIKGPCLLITASEDSADEFHSDAVFWSKTLGATEPILIQPRGDPLRLKNLKNLYTSDETKVISSVEAALSPVWHRDEFQPIRLSKCSNIEPTLCNSARVDRDSFIEQLKDLGYRPVSVVSAEGELSVRGGIIDVFPPDEEFPIRIEFFGDEVESLRLFDIDTQMSIKEIEEASISPVVEPEEGGDLFELLAQRMLILNEPDDIKRKYPELIQRLHGREIIRLTSLPLRAEGFNFNMRSLGGLGLLKEERRDIIDFVKRVKELKKEYFILMVCSSEGQAKRLRELFSEEGTEAPILPNDAAMQYTFSPVITIGKLSKGFTYQDIIVLTERDIFGKRPVFKPIKKSRLSRLISSLEDFNEGDYVVHKQHGIGRFLGIKRQKIEDYEGDFITIEYLGGDKLHIPLEGIGEIQKYHAPQATTPKIDKLGGRTWQKTKQRVKNRIKDMAEKLLRLYARRSVEKGYAFSAETELHREFDGFFSYEETPDQLTSIEEIKQDMEASAPMDRLLCGDVGYGKTEVAMRAAFKAVYDGKQVAVLAPTTILVEQHYNTFISRFSGFPVRIDFLSRFKSRAEQKQTIKALSKGEIDIIIGTHRLLCKDVVFYDLGLLIMDEEHRFGVGHKEKIKTIKTNVDVLTLSATPIPRTLQMTLSGIRAMSVIETPPEDRLSVRSFVARFSPEIIKDALEKELERGGQAFFIHNRIEDIHKIANFLKGLLPEAKIAIAHGQMAERGLEEVMRSFIRKEVDILVSTSIIGSGLDIPTANTIIINRAHGFGLADLYQLRGRVGRSNIRANAYFLIPWEETITKEARERLQAIQELSYLGAGFRLALRDLEIRGAGNLLGPEQSGHISAVGFDLYVEMLEQAVRELKGEEVAPEIEPLLDLKVRAMIPEDYIDDPTVRLSLYRRIAGAKDTGYLRELLKELKDRFGDPPQETLRLLQVMELKLIAKRLAITRIQNLCGRIKVIFAPMARITTQKIFELYKGREGYIKFLPEGGIEIDMRGRTWQETFKELKDIIFELER